MQTGPRITPGPRPVLRLVELAVLHAAGESGPFSWREDERGPFRILTVADRDDARQIAGHLHAVRAISLASDALTPNGAGQIHVASHGVDQTGQIRDRRIHAKRRGAKVLKRQVIARKLLRLLQIKPVRRRLDVYDAAISRVGEVEEHKTSAQAGMQASGQWQYL